MATRRRDLPPGKVKTEPSPSQTTTTITKSHSQYHNPTPPQQKGIPNYLRSTLRSSAIDVSKQQIKKPIATNTALKPTNTVRRPLDKTPLPARKTRASTIPISLASSDKTPLPARKTHVSTNPIYVRSSDKTPLSARKTYLSTNPSSQKLVPSKNLKAPSKDVEKRRSLYAIPVIPTVKKSTVKKSSIVCQKEQETEKSVSSATKEQIANTFQENVEIPRLYHVPEVETLPADQESCVVEVKEPIIQEVSNDKKVTVDLVPDDQEKPLDVEQIEAENKEDNDDDDDENDKEAKIVTGESSPVLEQQVAPLVITTQESENTPPIEEKLEELDANEIDSNNNINQSLADDNNNTPKEEAEEKEVKEVEKEVVEKEKQEDEEKELEKKDETANDNEVIMNSTETKGQEAVEEKKQESENVTQRQKIAKGKKESVVSNDVIEETASKLREQRKNRVRALAGAFETVISLQ